MPPMMPGGITSLVVVLEIIKPSCAGAEGWPLLSLFMVAGNHRHFKFGLWIEHSKSQPADDKASLKCAWSRHVTQFKFLVPLRYLWNGLI